MRRKSSRSPGLRRTSRPSSRSNRSDTERPDWALALAHELRRRRKELRLTQIELAALARCGPDFLYDVENAKPTLRLDKLVGVLEVLGLRLLLQSGRGGIAVESESPVLRAVSIPVLGKVQ